MLEIQQMDYAQLQGGQDNEENNSLTMRHAKRFAGDAGSVGESVPNAE